MTYQNHSIIHQIHLNEITIQQVKVNKLAVLVETVCREGMRLNQRVLRRDGCNPQNLCINATPHPYLVHHIIIAQQL